MKYVSHAQKMAQNIAHTSNPDTAAGSNGTSIAPPAYGINIVDNESGAAVSKQVQEFQVLGSTTWPAGGGSIQRQATIPLPDTATAASEIDQENAVVSQASIQLSSSAPAIQQKRIIEVEDPDEEELQMYAARPVPAVKMVQHKRTISIEENLQTEANKQTSANEIRKVASQGVRGSGESLPHLDSIQRSFGKHNVSDVRAFTDANAARANQEIGAMAYTTGTHIAFREPSPSLRLAAHEAAHVIQQRNGVYLQDGVGRTGDVYERHADTVADVVVQGRSAEELLDLGATRTSAPRMASAAAAPDANKKAAQARTNQDSAATIQLNGRSIEKGWWNKVTFTLESFNPNMSGQYVYNKKGTDRVEIRGARKFEIDSTVKAASSKAEKVYNYKTGYIQTLLEGWYKFYYRPLTHNPAANEPDTGASNLQGIVVKAWVPTPIRDAKDNARAPWYQQPTSFQNKTQDTQYPDMLDSPAWIRPWVHKDMYLVGITGQARFRTWLVVRRKSDGWIGPLAYADWKTDPGATITIDTTNPSNSRVNPTGRGTLMDSEEADGGDIAMKLTNPIANQSNQTEEKPWRVATGLT